MWLPTAVAKNVWTDSSRVTVCFRNLVAGAVRVCDPNHNLERNGDVGAAEKGSSTDSQANLILVETRLVLRSRPVKPALAILDGRNRGRIIEEIPGPRMLSSYGGR